MISQSLGNYLLNKGYLTREQILKAFEMEQKKHIKIGVIAIGSGKLTAEQVEEINQEQKNTDKRFGEIAISKGYINQEELEYMLEKQNKENLGMMQAIMDLNYMTMSELDVIIKEYNEKYQMDDSEKDSLDDIIRTYIRSHTGDSDFHFYYINLIVRNINRFMDTVVIVSEVEELDRLKEDLKKNKLTIINQTIKGDKITEIYIAMDNRAIEYYGRKISENDDDISNEEAMEEFLNIQNGLFAVNMSDETEEFQLEPPIIVNELEKIDIIYSLESIHGTMYVVLN